MAKKTARRKQHRQTAPAPLSPVSQPAPPPVVTEQETASTPSAKSFFSFLGFGKKKPTTDIPLPTGSPAPRAATATLLHDTASDTPRPISTNEEGIGTAAKNHHHHYDQHERPSATAAAGSDTAQTTQRTLMPGSDGEHFLQKKYGTEDRAVAFYIGQVLDHLAPLMQEFIAKQEFMFIASADRHGECDCTSKFGSPGFIRVLNEKYLMYPERRGNGVFANLGNITENSHVGLLIIDFYQDTIGLHVNGKARIIDNEELLEYQEKLPQSILDEIAQEGVKQPERWVMVEVEEAYVQCSKHIPLLKKLDKRIDWGTDSTAAKKVDYFQLQSIPLYERIGGDKAMEIAVDVFYQKVVRDELIGKFFANADLAAQRLKLKSFLAMAFGGPYQYSGRELREAHQHLVDRLGLTDSHFDRIIQLFRETLNELRMPAKEITRMAEILESFRHDVLGRSR